MSQAGRNVEAVRRGYEAFNTADMAALTELFDEDASWHTPGRSSIAGDAVGRDAVFAQFGLVALREFFDDVVDFSQLAGFDNFVESGQRVGHLQVFVNGAGEQQGFLRDDAEVGAQFVGGEVADIPSVDHDAAVGRAIEAKEQFGQRAFAGTRNAFDQQKFHVPRFT